MHVRLRNQQHFPQCRCICLRPSLWHLKKSTSLRGNQTFWQYLVAKLHVGLFLLYSRFRSEDFQLNRLPNCWPNRWNAQETTLTTGNEAWNHLMLCMLSWHSLLDKLWHFPWAERLVQHELVLKNWKENTVNTVNVTQKHPLFRYL